MTLGIRICFAVQVEDCSMQVGLGKQNFAGVRKVLNSVNWFKNLVVRAQTVVNFNPRSTSFLRQRISFTSSAATGEGQAFCVLATLKCDNIR